MGHETPWNNPRVGKTKTEGRKADEGRPFLIGCRPDVELLSKQRLSMVASVSEERRERIEAHPGFRPSPAVELSAEAQADADTLSQCVGRRILHGSVDPGPDRGGDPAAPWSELSPLPYLEAPSGPGLVLPEAQVQGPREERGRHRALETVSVAAYKKKPNDLGPISSSSTKAGSSSSRTSVGPGRRGAKRRFCAVPATGRSSRRSRPWWFRRAAGAWRSMPAFTPGRTSTRYSRPSSWATCSKPCVATLCFCGTAAANIRDCLSATSSGGICACIRSTSLAMPPSSIRRSGSGSWSRDPWPTARPRTFMNLRPSSTVRSSGCGNPKNCSGPASTPLSSHGNDERLFHYLCKGQ